MFTSGQVIYFHKLLLATSHISTAESLAEMEYSKSVPEIARPFAIAGIQSNTQIIHKPDIHIMFSIDRETLAHGVEPPICTSQS